MSDANMDRRQFLRGVVGALGVAAAEGLTATRASAGEQPRSESKESKDVWQARLAELRDRIVFQELPRKVQEIQKYFGLGAEPFFAAFDIRSSLRIVEQLWDKHASETLWTNNDPLAKKFQELWPAWSHAHWQQRREQEPRVERVIHPEYGGFKNEAEFLRLWDFFVPKGWRIPKIQWTANGQIKTITLGNVQGIYHPLTGGVTLIGTTTPRTVWRALHQQPYIGITNRIHAEPFYSFIQGTFLHEAAHANDWNFGQYSTDMRIEMLWGVMERMKDPESLETFFQNYYGTRWGDNLEPEADKPMVPIATATKIQQAAEFWAEACAQWSDNKTSQFIIQMIAKIDPNVAQMWGDRDIPPAKEMLIDITFKNLERLVTTEIETNIRADKRSEALDVWKRFQTDCRALEPISSYSDEEGKRQVDKYFNEIEKIKQTAGENMSTLFRRYGKRHKSRMEFYMENFSRLHKAQYDTRMLRRYREEPL
jgi:hypothetical protein